MKTAIYARAAGDDTENQITLQIMACKEWIEANGHECVATYIDSGVEGMMLERPQFNVMLNDAWNGRFQLVVMPDSGVLARGAKVLQTLLGRLAGVSSLKLAYASTPVVVLPSAPTVQAAEPDPRRLVANDSTRYFE